MTTDSTTQPVEDLLARIEDLIEEEQYDQAHELAKGALEAHGEDASVQATFTEILVEQGEYEQAIEHLEALLGEDSEVSFDDEDRGNLLNIKAHAHFYNQDFDVARHTFNEALRTDKENWTALIGRAMVHEAMGFYVASILDLDHAVSIDDQEPEPFSLRGQVYLKRGDLQEATRDFGYAVEIDAGDENAALQYARLVSLQGRTADAIEALEFLVEQGQETDYVYPAALLRSQLSLTLGSSEAAAEDANRAIDLLPEAPWGYLQLAACHITGMKGDDALAALKKAESLIEDPRDIPDIFVLRANAYELNDKHDQAQREKKKAEGAARLPYVVYGPILNPARNAPLNPDRPIDIRAILTDLFGDPNAAPDGYEDALRDVIDKIPSIIEENPDVERIQIELPEVEGMREGTRNLVIQVNKQQGQ